MGKKLNLKYKVFLKGQILFSPRTQNRGNKHYYTTPFEGVWILFIKGNENHKGGGEKATCGRR